eukprot:CAMPEP_0183710058 /NCGR_PEP_ID=MMETSP0737-20130205/5928_1 /TAXON_ID=385413 /ORGANISM="Thalassiosira miniscula, Strain CCMP1093" /LENGTH=388 /DNA_ID=CAMNT_0025938281 /DNA_START=56 /DNA_END=1222 /DNA_ORIENTATION=+
MVQPLLLGATTDRPPSPSSLSLPSKCRQPPSPIRRRRNLFLCSSRTSPLVLLVTTILLLCGCCFDHASSFSPPSSSSVISRRRSILSSPYRSTHYSPSSSSSSLHLELEEDDTTTTSTSSPQEEDAMKSLGEQIILQAALSCGATEPMIDVQWKSNKIVVTIDVNNDDNYDPDRMLLNEDEEEDGDWTEMEDEDIDWEEDEIEEYDEDFEIDPEAEAALLEELDLEPDDSNNGGGGGGGGVEVTKIAKTINILLAEDGEDSPKFDIARRHSIEVTTPEFDNVLRGKVMFESYKGFDVSVEHWEEPKKKKNKKKKGKAQKESSAAEEQKEEEPVVVAEPKLKVTEGKLVGKDYEKDVTMINVKGRVVKIKNDKIECVRLPTAKREKGVK